MLSFCDSFLTVSTDQDNIWSLLGNLPMAWMPFCRPHPVVERGDVTSVHDRVSRIGTAAVRRA